MCLTTDILQENIHFRTSYYPPQAIGHKALAVNISDLAGMGCSPRAFLLSLVLPDRELKWEFYSRMLEGMAELAQNQAMTLLGGNISRGRDLSLGITAWGEAGRRVLTRRALPGDYIFLLGDVGTARTGLHVLEYFPEQQTQYPRSVHSLLYPSPLVEEARALPTMPYIRGLMDISDGLLLDLSRLLGPNHGADLDKDLHLDPEIYTYARNTGQDPLRFALVGGEDYALLGTVAAQGIDSLKASLPRTTFMGRVSRKSGIRINGEPVHPEGFDHMRKIRGTSR